MKERQTSLTVLERVDMSNVITDPVVSANAAGLRYVTDRMPGIRRVRARNGFKYLQTTGELVRDEQVLQRIKRLAIPPAWTEVWICPLAQGHLQAVGRDARKRKQYRYHSHWRTVRDTSKFERMTDFGKALPKIRAQMKHDLAKSGLPKEKVLATIVWLLEETLIRVGNEEYAKQNNSFGLTTLRNRHVEITGATVNFYFRGKSGIKHQISVEDKHLARIVRRLRDLPGYELFQYLDESGQPRSVGSTDVNEYLREIAQEDFTAKDFRTWVATILMVEALSTDPPGKSTKQRKGQITDAITTVAKRLGNTVSVCRKCYVHPAVIETYLNGNLPERGKPILAAREQGLIRFLQKWNRKSAPMKLEQALTESVHRMRKGVRSEAVA